MAGTLIRFSTFARRLKGPTAEDRVLLAELHEQIVEEKAELDRLTSVSCERYMLLDHTVRRVRQHPISQRERVLAAMGLDIATYQEMVNELAELATPITKSKWEIAALEITLNENHKT